MTNLKKGVLNTPVYNPICFMDPMIEIHVTIKLQTFFTDKTITKLINFPVTLYRTVQKLKSTGKGGVDMGKDMWW